MFGSYQPNRVLLPQSPFFFFEVGRAGTSGHHLPFLLQELIGHGLTEVTIRDYELSFIYKEMMPHLPSILKNRIKAVSTESSHRTALHLLRNLVAEFNIEPDLTFTSFKPVRGGDFTISNDIAYSIISVFHTVAYFIDAINARAQCEIDLVSTLKHVDRIKIESKSPEVLAELAVLRAVFGNYSEVSHAAIESKTNSSAAIAEIFDELILQVEYASLSAELYKFGLVRDVSNLTPRVKRLVGAILRSRLGKQFLDYGSRIINVYTGVPVPTSEFAAALMRDSYFPPIVNLSKATAAAGSQLARSYDGVSFYGPGTSKG
jgi:hypothetical protein